jgi:hypothetical protein
MLEEQEVGPASTLGVPPVKLEMVPMTSGCASLKFECWAFWYSVVAGYWLRACVSQLMGRGLRQ